MADKQLWSGDNARRIEQRIIVEGDLELLTPALFGNGDSDQVTDMPLLVDAYDGVTPLLTGSTLAGALRAYLYAWEQGFRQAMPKTKAQRQQSRNSLTGVLFGAFKGDDDGLQSALIIDDAYGEQYSIGLRDGVRIDPKSRTAQEGKLFDMQVWQTGTIFPIRFELLIIKPRRKRDESSSAFDVRVKETQQKVQQALLLALTGLNDGGITLGGRKRRGFGRIAVKNWRVKTYTLTNPAHLLDWLQNGNKPLEQQKTSAKTQLADHAPFDQIPTTNVIDQRHLFRMEATFHLDGSLLIRSAGQSNRITPDMVHLSDQHNRPILPGTSIAGALRNRALRILKLLNNTQATQWLDDLFGADLPEGRQKRTQQKNSIKSSRLTVEESVIEKAQFDLVQNRVAIDRFTGGAKDSALFNEQPVFSKPETRLQINLTIHNPKKYEIGLLLLLLKDLWTGDLSLGGEASVGRGRLRGLSAEMHYRHDESGHWKTEHWYIKQKAGQLEIDGVSAEKLEEFVPALHTGEPV